MKWFSLHCIYTTKILIGLASWYNKKLKGSFKIASLQDDITYKMSGLSEATYLAKSD